MSNTIGNPNQVATASLFISATEWNSTTALIAANTNFAYTWRMNASTDDVRYAVKIPDTWDGTSAITLTPFWCPDLVNAPADTETFVWDLSWENMKGTLGSATTPTGTYTQSGAGAANEYLTVDINIDPLASGNEIIAGDVLSFTLSYDATASTYNGTEVRFYGATLTWG